MTLAPFSLLRDDFENNVVDPLWAASTTGSATAAETGAQARFTLPSSTAGSHDARYTSTGTYDLTADSCFVTIGTMVATGVAATAYFQLTQGGGSGNALQWVQLSNTLKAQTVVAGVATDRYSVTWNASTYKYLRIRESGGTTFFDSSTNGTSWTNRASIANPIAVTALYAIIGAVCGNVASPGSFRLDEFNVILPAPSATWRETTADWSIVNRFMPVTLASDGGMVGVIVTADTMDETTRALGGTLHYFAGPLGASSGGFLQLTEYASLVLAQASAFPVPVDDRADLPILVDARYMRLYHRSIDASPHTVYEFVPQRLVQAEMIQAESIQAINIAAGAVTADKIFVLTLAAITANIGGLNIDTAGYLWQGTGTAASPTTGLKIYNSGGVGKLSTYNSGVEQVTLDTDGRLKAGAGAVQLDADGLAIEVNATSIAIRAYQFVDSGGVLQSSLGGSATSADTNIALSTESVTGKNGITSVVAHAPSGKIANVLMRSIVDSHGSCAISVNTTGAGVNTITLGDDNTATVNVPGGINVGSATGATAGQISTSDSVGVGVAAQSNIRLITKGAGTTSAAYGFFVQNSAGTTECYVRNDGVGFLNNTAWNYSSDATKKRNIRTLNKDIRDFMLLEPKMFDYIDGPANRYGYIGQDVQAIMPELVSTEPDGGLALATTDLIPLFNHVLRRLIRILIQKGILIPADIA